MKHERAAIMALTFCIGFTTGLIAYGLPSEDIPTAYVPAVTSTASVASSKAVRESPSLAAVDTTESVFSYVESDADGFYHVINGERTLVSPHVALAGDLPEAHTAIHSPVVSRDARFVFFCAETLSSGSDCLPRVFNADTFSVHAVIINGTAATYDPAEVSAAWTSVGELQINERISVSPQTPWVLQ